jgi:hypothetical protein
MPAKPGRTWLAIIVCAVTIVIPGLLVGAAGAFIYRLFVSRDLGPDPDVLMMRTLFGFDAPGQLIKWTFYVGIPSGIHRGIPALIAAGSPCRKSFTRRDQYRERSQR